MVSLVVDLGTTTIVIKVVGDGGIILDEVSVLNPQRLYGLDVLTRIKAANNGKGKILQKLVVDEIAKLINENRLPLETSCIKSFILAGNTVMMHLFFGLSVEKLGVFPFTPDSLTYPFELPEAIRSIVGDSCELKVFPSISAFIGGDVVAGIYSLLENDKTFTHSLLIDLGTNGEIVLIDGDDIIVSSAAAGPAFEGGGIKCGTGCVDGAIYRAYIYGRQAQIEVYKNKASINKSEKCSTKNNFATKNMRTFTHKSKEDIVYHENEKDIGSGLTIDSIIPSGICATGAIDLVASLKSNGLVDKNGLLIDEYFEDGFFVAKSKDGKEIRIYQEDIRNIQLAKAAIRTGVDLLLESRELEYKDIDSIFLAGSLGENVNIKSIIDIGLLPSSVSNKIIPIGNSVIDGCIKAICDEKFGEYVKTIVDKSKNVELVNDERFNHLFLENMHL